MEQNQTKEILVIDDDDVVRQSIAFFLEDRLYNVIQARNGKEGLQRLESEEPDLVLCDLRMPLVDGLEVLTRMKERESKIPVIIISGTGEMSDTIASLRLGAWDFVMKPVTDMDLLLHSVEAAFEKRELIEAKEQYSAQLESANAELTEAMHSLESTRDQLIQARKMESLGVLVGGVAHEINTPVGVGVTASSHLSEISRELKEKIGREEISTEDLFGFVELVQGMSETIHRSLEKAANTTSIFKEIAAFLPHEDSSRTDLSDFLEGLANDFNDKDPSGRYRMNVQSDERVVVNTFQDALTNIFRRLIDNSMKHGFKEAGHGQITISCSSDDESVTIKYSDDGIGMNDELKAKAFDPFFTTTRGSGDIGLGLSIVFNQVSQNMKGRIELDEEVADGVGYRITLPHSLPDHPVQ